MPQGQRSLSSCTPSTPPPRTHPAWPLGLLLHWGRVLLLHRPLCFPPLKSNGRGGVWPSMHRPGVSFLAAQNIKIKESRLVSYPLSSPPGQGYSRVLEKAGPILLWGPWLSSEDLGNQTLGCFSEKQKTGIWREAEHTGALPALPAQEAGRTPHVTGRETEAQRGPRGYA